MKHQIVHTLQKYLLNPPIKLACDGSAAARICVARNDRTEDVEVGAGNVGTKLGTSLAYIASVLIKSLEMSDHEIRLRAIEELMRVRSIRSGGLEE